MTLPEVLVAVVLVGMIVSVLATAVSVIFRQSDNTEGRLNVARVEQSLGLWLPGDLASAASSDTNPLASPCGTACPDGVPRGGSNALLLSWTEKVGGVTTTTNVSYYFSRAKDGTFQLSRVECTSTGSGWRCDTLVVIRDLPGPPGGVEFTPGMSPTWMLQVSDPPTAGSVDGGQRAPGEGTQVVVSVSGGGDSRDAGGGMNQISISAGGVGRSILAPIDDAGVPSFVDARSRCGGSVVLIVDESSSIGSAITDVKKGVRTFVAALRGTPVKLQVVGFHSYSHVLGTAGWSRYFDMSNPTEFNALLAAVDTLGGNYVGTNWEEAFFRTFFNPDGTTAPTIPKTVVFFTDGVPNTNRVKVRTAPGVLPADPPPPDPIWDQVTNGRQRIGFDRANYIATQFRTSTTFIGVGVGPDISGTSTWVLDPGSSRWERGSWTYQKATYTYQARYQTRKNATSNTWTYVTKAVFDTTATNLRRDSGWKTITAAQYAALESPANDVATDGVQRLATWNPISTADFTAGNTTPTDVDGFRANPTGKQYAAPYLDWEPWTGPRTGAVEQYREAKVAPVVTTVKNSSVLARLVAGNDFGVPALWNGAAYTNSSVANLYVLPQWSQFATAMESVALGDCGGTLTLQTRLGDSPAPDPFSYQRARVTDAAGSPVKVEASVVTTSGQTPTGTFDFGMGAGQFVTVDIQPANLSNLTRYRPVGWSCTAGATDRTVQPVPIAGSVWSGIRVRVGANEAVSCTLTVTAA